MALFHKFYRVNLRAISFHEAIEQANQIKAVGRWLDGTPDESPEEWFAKQQLEAKTNG